jgi:acetyltransferase-like isoleucine patch superfamily enzyme
MKFNYTLKQKVQSRFARYIMPFVTLITFNDKLNTLIWKLLGVKIGKNSIIRIGTYINPPFNVVIGNECLIHGHIKARGGY